MAIQSGNLATASDLNALKTALLTLYANRPVKVNGRQLSKTTSAPYSLVKASTATQGNLISTAQMEAINGVLVINDIPNILTQAGDAKILADGRTTAILSWVNTYKSATGTSTSHGCRGACVGICTDACTWTCKFECTASSVGTIRDEGTNPSVGTQIGTNCTGSSCSGQCKGNCKTVCYWECKSGCMNGCKGTCRGCSGCYTACNTGCRGSGNVGVEEI